MKSKGANHIESLSRVVAHLYVPIAVSVRHSLFQIHHLHRLLINSLTDPFIGGCRGQIVGSGMPELRTFVSFFVQLES